MSLYYRLLFVLVISSFFLSFQAKKEYDFKWGLQKDEHAVYTVSARSEKKDSSRFIIFGTDLNEDGTNSLLVNTYKDIAYKLIFMLPKDLVKVGSSWQIDQQFFEDGNYYFMKTVKMLVKGNYTLKRIIKEKKKDEEIELAPVEANLNLVELSYDLNTNKLLSTNPIGTIKASIYFTTTNTILHKADVVMNIKGSDLTGQILPETINFNEHLELAEIRVQKEDNQEFNKRVNETIEQGVKFLKDKHKQDKEGVLSDTGRIGFYKSGCTALALMALIHSGVKIDEPIIQTGFKYIVNDFKRNSNNRMTYNVSLLIIAIETKYIPVEKYKEMTGFSEEEAKEHIKKSILKEDVDLIKEASQWLINNQTRDGTWGYPEYSSSLDHSNTQYALLALKSASRCGVDVPYDVWSRAADHFIKLQYFSKDEKEEVLDLTYFDEKLNTNSDQTIAQLKAKPGPWGYTVRDVQLRTDPFGMKKYAAMTCAGLTSLRICESELYQKDKLDKQLKRKIEKAKKSGLAWLQRNFTVRANYPSGHLFAKEWLYYLFSLERVGILFGIRKIKEHDWYHEGAVLLLDSQLKDGSWASPLTAIPEFDHHGPIVDTCFALLFLKKATLQVATPK